MCAKLANLANLANLALLFRLPVPHKQIFKRSAYFAWRMNKGVSKEFGDLAKQLRAKFAEQAQDQQEDDCVRLKLAYHQYRDHRLLFFIAAYFRRQYIRKGCVQRCGVLEI